MQYRVFAAAVALAALTSLPSLTRVAGAQPPQPPQRLHPKASAAHRAHETQADLQKEAAISMDSARALAARTVPGGKIESSELEREHGKLIYSFDLRVAGKSGIEEVNVDAKNGALVAHEHESPKAERAEAKQEARAGAKAKAPRTSTAHP